MLAQPGGIPVPTPRGAATQMPPSVGPAPKTVVVAAHTRTVPTPKPKPAPAPSPLAAALPGVDQEAALRAQLAVTPAVQAAQAAQAQDNANTTAQAKLLAGYYGALGPLLAQIAPGVQAGYQQAAGTDAILGSAFGGQLNGQDAANASQAASILQGQGAPAGQIANAQTAAGTPGLGDALGWLNAGLPAQGLTQAGAAYGAAARMLPASVAGIGGQEIAQNNTLGAAQNATEQQKIDNAVARIPGLINTYAPEIQRQDITANTPKTFGSGSTGYFAIDPATGQVTQVTGGAPKTFGDAASGFYSIDPNTGKVTQISAGQPKSFGSSGTGEFVYNPATGKITQVAAAEPKTFGSSSSGYFRLNANGSVQQLTAAKPPTPKIVGTDKTGRYVLNPSDGTLTPLPGPLGKPAPGSTTSSSTVRLIATHIDGMYAGSAPKYIHDPGAAGADANGFVQEPTSGPQSYTDAVNYAIAAYNGNKTAAINAVNRIYQPGYPQANGSAIPGVSRPYAGKQAVSVALGFMKAANAHGETKAQAAAKAASLQLLPAAAINSALKTVYGVTVKQKGGLGITASAPGIG